MKTIYNEYDLEEILQRILGRDFTVEERARQAETMKWWNDPKRGYKKIDDDDSLAYWLYDTNGNYSLANFSGGIGLLGNRGGGCWGYLSDTYEAELLARGWLVKDSYGSPSLSIEASTALRGIVGARMVESAAAAKKFWATFTKETPNGR